jgi:hypothetical protein
MVVLVIQDDAVSSSFLIVVSYSLAQSGNSALNGLNTCAIRPLAATILVLLQAICDS